LEQVFEYNLTASRTLLGRSPGIDFHEFDPGTFGLGSKRQNEVAPGNIADRPAQPIVLEQFVDAQALDRDKSVATDQFQSSLVMMLASEVRHSCVGPGNLLASFAAVLAVPFFTGEASLFPAKLRKCCFEVPRIGLFLARVRGEKRGQPDVDSDSGIGRRLNLYVSEIAREDHIPLVGFPNQSDGLDLTFDRSMQFDPDRPDVLDAEPLPVELDSVAVSGELDRIESVSSFEPRESGFLACFDSSKECDVGFVKSPHCRLGAAEVEASEERIHPSFVLEPTRAIRIADRRFVDLVGKLSVIKADIVQATMRFEHRFKLSLLILVCPESELECPSHRLLSFLICDIALNRCSRDVTDRAGEVTPAPKRRQSGSQRGELLPQYPRCKSFQPVHDLGNAERWIAFHEEVNVVGHDLEGVNRHAQLSGLLIKQDPQAMLDIASQNGPSILRAPHDVILEREDGPLVFSVSVVHALDYTTDRQLVKCLVSREECGHSPVA
jgi:hypothetical protein